MSLDALICYKRRFDRVFICDRFPATARIDSVSAQVEFVSLPVDARDPVHVKQAIDQVEPDHILNFVGGGRFRLISESDSNSLAETVLLNLIPAQTISVAFWNFLSRTTRNGSIVHVSSINATSNAKGYAAYTAGKSALEGYIRASALELAPILRIYGVRPGPVASSNAMANTIKNASIPFHILEKRLTTGADISEVAYALHNHFKWSTGEIVNVDGGLLLGNEK